MNSFPKGASRRFARSMRTSGSQHNEENQTLYFGIKATAVVRTRIDAYTKTSTDTVRDASDLRDALGGG